MLRKRAREGDEMRGKKHSPEQIIKLLREFEIESGKGATVDVICRKHGINVQTYYRWKKEFGGLRVEQAKRLKDLEAEKAKLKRLVADLSLDNSVLKEVAKGNF